MAKADQHPFIIGGGEIYHLALAYADVVELTRVHTEVEADAFFPELPANEWELIAEEFHPADNKHEHSFTYQSFKRK